MVAERREGDYRDSTSKLAALFRHQIKSRLHLQCKAVKDSPLSRIEFVQDHCMMTLQLLNRMLDRLELKVHRCLLHKKISRSVVLVKIVDHQFDCQTSAVIEKSDPIMRIQS